MNNLSVHEVINEIENSINNLDINENRVLHEFTSKNGKIYDVEISYKRRDKK